LGVWVLRVVVWLGGGEEEVVGGGGGGGGTRSRLILSYGVEDCYIRT
jgi:hypothetical protein